MSISLSCIIIEDDHGTRDMIRELLERSFDDIKIVAEASEIEEAKKKIISYQPDFVILDINLKDGNSFELLRSFENIQFKIIFVTSFSTYAIEAFRFSAIDYVMKPFDPQVLLQAVEKVQKEHQNEQYQLQIRSLLDNLQPSGDKKIVLKNADAIYVVPLAEIIYAKSDNNYTTFFTKDQREILVSRSLKRYEEDLKNHSFFRVHQTFLINLAYITSFYKKREEVILDQKHAIPVAQSKKKALLHIIDTLF
ncbi:LytR/AlgR family response regulator transcription factor [Aquimarina hainanensis]|uniref:LytR/AlgR family response regulator transcription factor n=1 Tax=Aquimarina hainanensis TaxID=1578017 RepID=A0ABW5NDD5_9FLAO